MRLRSPRPERGRPRPVRPAGRREGGQISVLLIGMVALALLLITGIVGATAVQLARIHLLDAADAAALDASDAIAEGAVYAHGLGAGVPLTQETVARAAAEHLATRELPARLASWQVVSAGTPDGRTAVVRVSGVARVPVVSAVLSSLGGGITITVEARARSGLVP